MQESREIRRERILIVNEDTLLAAGLKSLLSRHPGLDVVALTPSGPAELIGELERFRPDMILLACGGPVTSPSELLGMLGEYPLVRVVAVSCDCNTAYVYDRVPVTVVALGDLLALIPPTATAPRTLTGAIGLA
jgi:DNA-binding NarL/FixJ family response regulator